MLVDDTTDLERVLVANMLVFNNVISEVVALIESSDLEDDAARRAFEEIVSVYNKEGRVDSLLLENTPRGFCAELVNMATSKDFTLLYAKKILGASLIRKALSFSEEVKALSEDGKADIEGYLAYVSSRATMLQQSRKTDNEYKVEQLIDRVRREAERNSTQDTVGIPTGLDPLDENTSGIQRGHLWVVGAYTSTGKTALATQIMTNMLLAGRSCVMLSNEMTAPQITLRILAILSGVPALKIYHGRHISPLEYTAIEKAYKELETFKLTIIENMNHIDKVMATIRGHADKDIVFLDYLGQVQTDDRTEYERMTTVSSNLQTVALQNQIPVFALSQVSNESAKGSSQVLGFKGSGNIAAVADVGIELYRDKEKEPTIMSVAIRKNRHGATGKFDVNFDLRSGRITHQKRME